MAGIEPPSTVVCMAWDDGVFMARHGIIGFYGKGPINNVLHACDSEILWQGALLLGHVLIFRMLNSVFFFIFYVHFLLLVK